MRFTNRVKSGMQDRNTVSRINGFLKFYMGFIANLSQPRYGIFFGEQFLQNNTIGFQPYKETPRFQGIKSS